MKTVRVKVNRVRPGDIALHRGGLDGREVSRIEQDSDKVWHVWIWIGQLEAGPFPAKNYVFIRRVNE